jgi:hypothetical protein
MTENLDPHAQHSPAREGSKRGRHVWITVACCIPLVVISIVLFAAGVVNAFFLLFALACTALMAFVMGGMKHGG